MPGTKGYHQLAVSRQTPMGQNSIMGANKNTTGMVVFCFKITWLKSSFQLAEIVWRRIIILNPKRTYFKTCALSALAFFKIRA